MNPADLLVENLNKAAEIAARCKARAPTEAEAVEFIGLTGVQREEIAHYMAIMNGSTKGCVHKH